MIALQVRLRCEFYYGTFCGEGVVVFLDFEKDRSIDANRRSFSLLFSPNKNKCVS